MKCTFYSVNCIDVIYSGEVDVKYHFVLLIQVNRRNPLPSQENCYIDQ